MPNEAANMATLWANNVSSGMLSRADERLKRCMVLLRLTSTTAIEHRVDLGRAKIVPRTRHLGRSFLN
jgi:hypothetical protein